MNHLFAGTFLSSLFGCRGGSKGDDRAREGSQAIADTGAAAKTNSTAVRGGLQPKRDIRSAAASIRNATDRERLEEARRLGPIIARLMKECGTLAVPGTTTEQIERGIAVALDREGLVSALKGYRGFPFAAAVSVNDQILSGFPSAQKLVAGDLVHVELRAASALAYASQSWTFTVGSADESRKRLIATAKKALQAAFQATRANAHAGDLGAAIQRTMESAHYSVVREYVGYGMGAERIQSPQLKCFGVPGTGDELSEGQMLHIQVIAKMGTAAVDVDANNWTVVAKDGQPGVVVSGMAEVTKDGAAWLIAPLDV